MTRLVVRGGLLVRPDRVEAGDLVVEEGRFVAVGGTHRGEGTEVDAGGLVVLPGGVDSHVHLMDPGPTEREDFPTGTAAASARGVTTIVEHTHAHPVRSVTDLRAKLSHLDGRANVDFALAAHLWPEDVAGMGDLWEAGVAFFKLFTCTTHGVPGLAASHLLDAFESLAQMDGRALVHCEDETITETAERRLKQMGRTDPGLLVEWRNREAELAAVAVVGVLALATGAKVTVAHVSNPKVAALIDQLRRLGGDVAAETCPQYLTLRESEVVEHGAFRKFTPPARIVSDLDEETMWALLRDGTFTHLSTDHAPSTVDQKRAGTIWEAPFGLPGLDTTYPFLIDAALSGRLDWTDVARLYAAYPADRYGLAPRKGRLAEGSDADFVLVDPAGSWTVTAADVISKAGWSPFEGRSFRGKVVGTYLRGRPIADEGGPYDLRTGSFLPGAGRR
ncbi:MAG: amidohydrolase [Acidimicrobiia bacterium]|nr:MAG: amidohydrolase [Acidimicrobiia bacterium]